MSPLLLSLSLLPVLPQGENWEIVWQLDGTLDSEEMGRQIKVIGDVDNNNGPDLLVLGGRSDNPVFAGGGAIHLVSSESGLILRTFGPLASMYHASTSQDHSFYGRPFSSLPDINADGIPDFAHESPFYSYEPTTGQWLAESAVYARSGSNGALLWMVKVSSLPGLDVSQTFSNIDLVGDWNGGGGTPDLFVSAGNLAFVLDSWYGLHIVQWDMSGDPLSGAFGTNVAAGDFDGDGDKDIAIGDCMRGGAQGAAQVGSVFLYDNPTGTLTHTFPGPQIAFSRFGYGLMCPGDVTNNGRDDIAMSWDDVPLGAMGGRVEIHWINPFGSWQMVGEAWTGSFYAFDELGTGAKPISGGYDMHQNGTLDMGSILGNPCGGIFFYEGGGNELGHLPPPSGTQCGGFGFNQLWLPDADGDGQFEIIVTAHSVDTGGGPNAVTQGGAVYRFDSNSSGGGSPGSGGNQSSPGGSWGTHGSFSGSAGDGVGHSIVSLGSDWDGDGKADVLVGAPWAAGGLGQVHILSSSTWTPFFSVSGVDVGDAFGWSIDRLGDVTGDGVQDFVVGAPNALDQSGLQTGAAYVVDGSTWTLAPLPLPIDQWNGYRDGWGFGFSVANGGDVDGDGVADIAVGAPFYPHASVGNLRVDSGAVSVFSGATRALIWEQLWMNYGYGRPDHFGYSVDGVGDVDGDGFDDIVVGNPGADFWNGSDRGHAHLFSGFDGDMISSLGGTSMGDMNGDQVVGEFDWNLDTIPDFAVGMPGLDDWGAMLGAGNNVGGVRIHSTGSGAVLTEVRGDTEGGRMGGSSGGDISIGDVNGDGHPDIVVGQGGVTGSLRSPNPDAGMITIYSGLTDSIVYRRLGTAAGDFLGEAAQVVGDLDGDGIADIATGAPLADPQGLVDAGEVVAEVFDPYIRTQTTSVSASAFTNLRWELDFPASYSNHKYHTLISESGVGPSTIGSLEVPLTLDQRMWDTIFGDYPTDNNWIGPLNANGDATIVQGVPPGAAAAFVGKTLYLAVVLHKPLRAPVLSSTVLPLTIIP